MEPAAATQAGSDATKHTQTRAGGREVDNSSRGHPPRAALDRHSPSLVAHIGPTIGPATRPFPSSSSRSPWSGAIELKITGGLLVHYTVKRHDVLNKLCATRGGTQCQVFRFGTSVGDLARRHYQRTSQRSNQRTSASITASKVWAEGCIATLARATQPPPRAVFSTLEGRRMMCKRPRRSAKVVTLTSAARSAWRFARWRETLTPICSRCFFHVLLSVDLSHHPPLLTCLCLSPFRFSRFLPKAVPQTRQSLTPAQEVDGTRPATRKEARGGSPAPPSSTLDLLKLRLRGGQSRADTQTRSQADTQARPPRSRFPAG
jgi:hypothetical protein